MDKSDRSISELCFVWFSRFLMIALWIRTVVLLPDSGHLAGNLLLQVFAGMLVFLRFYRKSSLVFIPDEMLVSIPFFWMIAASGEHYRWSGIWLVLLFLAFAASMLHNVSGKNGFNGGICKNSLLLAIWCSVVFILVMAIFLVNVLPAFDIQLFRSTVINLFICCAGISVSQSVWFSLLVAVDKRKSGIVRTQTI